MATNAKILIVDDEEDILEFLEYNLSKEGYEVQTAQNGEVALQKAKSFMPHLIILDIMMPEVDGIEVCEKLRFDNSFDNTLIAFLTARSESFTQITALEVGGDDFINKPIKPSVFKSRVKAILRRHPQLSANDKDGGLITIGEMEIDPDQFTVKVGDEKPKALAKKEYELLTLLASNPGKVFKRHEILDRVWGDSVIVGDRTIDVHIRKLREKIGKSMIKTLKGVGYKLDAS